MPEPRQELEREIDHSPRLSLQQFGDRFNSPQLVRLIAFKLYSH
jgi:hypothetical protein